MKHKNLVNAMKKAGLEVTQPEYRNGMFQVKGPVRFVEWYEQNGSAICVNVRRHGDESDLMVDYHAGFFVETIKFAVKCALENN